MNISLFRCKNQFNKNQGYKIKTNQPDFYGKNQLTN
jgi:hypothetical protein